MAKVQKSTESFGLADVVPRTLSAEESHAPCRLASERISAAATAAWDGLAELPLFPRPEAGPVLPGNRCVDEIADLEELFAAGELTWTDYSQRLRELAPPAEVL